MIIKTKQFILRPAKLQDAKNIYLYQQEKEAIKNFMSVPKNVNEVIKDIKKNKMKGLFGESFVIDIGGEALREVSFYQIDPRNKTKAKISFWIAKKVRGRGIMTKAVKLITKYAFEKCKLVRIQGNVRTFNKASARVMEKAGYTLEGALRKNNYKNGKFLNDMIYAKVK